MTGEKENEDILREEKEGERRVYITGRGKAAQGGNERRKCETK